MPISKREVTRNIRVLDDGRIRKDVWTYIEEDGVEIASVRKSAVIEIEDNVALEDALIKDIAQALWTPQRKAARLETINQERALAGKPAVSRIADKNL